MSFSIAFPLLLITFFFSFQLKICKGISYAAVAAHAEKCDRRKLAAMLVDHEPLSSKQVVLMIDFNLYIFWRNVSMLYFSCKIRNSKFYAFIRVGSTSPKHWRRRYGIDKGNWKWWYGSCLPCYFSYLAEGILLITVVMVLDCCFYELISLSNFVNTSRCLLPSFLWGYRQDP